jgi:hypothetical protein
VGRSPDDLSRGVLLQFAMICSVVVHERHGSCPQLSWQCKLRFGNDSRKRGGLGRVKSGSGECISAVGFCCVLWRTGVSARCIYRRHRSNSQVRIPTLPSRKVRDIRVGHPAEIQ